MEPGSTGLAPQPQRCWSIQASASGAGGDDREGQGGSRLDPSSRARRYSSRIIRRSADTGSLLGISRVKTTASLSAA